MCECRLKDFCRDQFPLENQKLTKQEQKTINFCNKIKNNKVRVHIKLCKVTNSEWTEQLIDVTSAYVTTKLNNFPRCKVFKLKYK